MLQLLRLPVQAAALRLPRRQPVTRGQSVIRVWPALSWVRVRVPHRRHEAACSLQRMLSVATG